MRNWFLDPSVGSALSSISTHSKGELVFQTPHWKRLGSGPLGQHVPKSGYSDPARVFTHAP